MDVARDRLSRVGWAAGLPDSLRQELFAACELRLLPAGAHVFGLDGPTGGVWGLGAGYANILIGAGPFPPVLAFIAQPGWWAGEAALLTGTRRRAEIVARTDAKLLYLSPARQAELEKRHPDIWRHLARITVEHLDNALLLAATLGRGDPRSKVLATLIRLAGPYQAVDAETAFPCSQQDLAELTALSRNSVGPALRDLEREGLVRRPAWGEIAFNPVILARTCGM